MAARDVHDSAWPVLTGLPCEWVGQKKTLAKSQLVRMLCRPSEEIKMLRFEAGRRAAEVCEIPRHRRLNYEQRLLRMNKEPAFLFHGIRDRP